MSSIAVKQTDAKQNTTVYKILFLIGLCHLLNDSIQAVIPAMFPILEKSMGLTFTQLGIIGFCLNIISSVMQPAIGWYTDKKPLPFALPTSLSFTFFGVLGLAFAPSYEWIVVSVLCIGLGSAIFHPEGSRVAYLAAGNRRGLAQSIYQVGGNTGSAMAPLITALLLVPFGQFGAVWFSLVAAVGVAILIYIAKWYSKTLSELSLAAKKVTKKINGQNNTLPTSVWIGLLIILFLIFARSWYISAVGNYYTFYAIETYSLSIKQSQILLFAFMAFGALGTFFGGPIADRFGKKTLIVGSLLMTIPLALLLPFVSLYVAFVLLVINGFVLMSSFSVTVVYAQELVPGKIGTMAGLTVGFAFGMGAIGSIALGGLADEFGLTTMFKMASFLPILGLLSLFLPKEPVAK